MEDETLDLGPCCACGKTGQDVRNIIALDWQGPTPGRGWGCFQCGLPNDGATATLCDTCLESGIELKFICTGYPATDGRTPIEFLDKIPFEHRIERHPEILATLNLERQLDELEEQQRFITERARLWQQITWFDESPDLGHPKCICSICAKQIPEPDEDDPALTGLRLFREPNEEYPHGLEARFCGECSPLVIKYMLRKQ